MSEWLLPSFLGLLAIFFGFDLKRALRGRVVQDSGFVVDRELGAAKYRFVIALKVIWLVMCLIAFAGSVLQALE